MNPSAAVQSLPCVVQLGFAGSRRLFVEPPADPGQLATWHGAVEEYLGERLGQIPTDLKLDPHHFLVGISQLACGADTLFARACRKREIPQRLFLPQHREAYLSAVGSNGKPDFSLDERAEAEALFEAEHVIQERVVSNSPDRTARFMATNVEILSVSDVVVCLLRDDAVGKTGGKEVGTIQLLDRAKARGIPVLEIRVGMAEGQPACRSQWHNQETFQAPRLPDELARRPAAVAVKPLPSHDQYRDELARLVSNPARGHQRYFKFAAVTIIGTHILATIFATIALATHGHGDGHAPNWPFLLAIEMLLLATGFGVHSYLHHSRNARLWAISRLTAELARSLRAIATRHLYLEHFFRLQLPHRFRHLLRTLNTLHLRSTWADRHAPWAPVRDRYVHQRIDGQMGFFERALEVDERRLRRCRLTFTVCSLTAITATAIELGLTLVSPGFLDNWSTVWPAVLGVLAIVLPVLAVGGLSWAAALDCEARVETFRETLEFLHHQRPLIVQATSAAEFDRLLLETETTLLGEIANWFSRRSNTGVA